MATAQLVLDIDSGKWQLVHEGEILTESTAKYYIRQQVRQGRYRSLGVTDVVDAEQPRRKVREGVTPEAETIDASLVGDKYSINERFDFVYQCAQAVARKQLPTLILTGEGGLGKSHTVMRAMSEAGLMNIRDIIGQAELTEGEEVTIGEEFNDSSFCLVKGYSSSKGLFNSLYENRDRVMVFDDCDSIFGKDDALNLLKSALDSCEDRWITWNAEASFGDNIPRTFKFTGSIVFITNKTLSQLDQAIRTRAVCIDLSMTINQIIERMRHIVNTPDFMPEVSAQCKAECMDFVDNLKDQVRTLSMRTLVNVIKMYNSCPNWQRVAEYAICR